MLSAGITLILSSFTIKPYKSSNDVLGIWKGSLGNETKMVEALIRLKQGHTVEYSEMTVKGSKLLKGTFRVLGDTALVVYIDKKGKGKRMVMHGNLNPTKSFVDGVWQEGQQEEGSFYLQKIR
jgi:hypothetical protein